MAKLYEIFSGEELKIAEKIQQRRYQILVHSYIYYELNENLVSDSQWSEWAMELASLQNKYPSISARVEYADDFKGWDGSSGAYLNYDTKHNIIVTANRLLQNLAPKKPTTLFTPTKQKNQPLFAPAASKSSANKTSTTKKKLF